MTNAITKDTLRGQLAEVRRQIAALKEEEDQILRLAKDKGWLRDIAVEGGALLAGIGASALLG